MHQITARLAGWVVQPLAPRVSAGLQSHFGRLRFHDIGVDVEVMGAVRKRTVAGSWSESSDPSHHRALLQVPRT